MSQHFLHIGMPRTATTFLQTHVFPNLPGVDYYGLPFTHINPAFNAAMFADDTVYKPNSLAAVVKQLDGEKVLISNESFVGQSLYWHFGNRTRIANRLQAAMPDATVLLFLRNQPDLIRSLYLIALQATETQTLSDYLRKPKPDYAVSAYREQPKVDLFDYAPYDTFHPVEQVAGYDYLPLITLYKALFPRVEIFLYEAFRTYPVETYRRLGEVLGIHLPDDILEQWCTMPALNTGTGNIQARWLRCLNRWHGLLQNSRLGRAAYARGKRSVLRFAPQGKPVRWSETDQTFLRDYFAPRNRALHAAFPEIGLSQFRSAYLLEE